MTEKQAKSSTLGKAWKMFLFIFVLLLVPVVLDQVDVDRETVRTVARVAVGIGILLLLYGVFSRMMKILAFIALAMLVAVFLLGEGTLKAPRVKQWLEVQGGK